MNFLCASMDLDLQWLMLDAESVLQVQFRISMTFGNGRALDMSAALAKALYSGFRSNRNTHF